jgi:hypothetical protein
MLVREHTIPLNGMGASESVCMHLGEKTFRLAKQLWRTPRQSDCIAPAITLWRLHNVAAVNTISRVLFTFRNLWLLVRVKGVP